jgi:3-phenylpropionate/trans-cinnamate dioxygenase ferredoxin reductase subunit
VTTLFAIVGAGQAAATAVEALRREGFDGRIVVIGDEQSPPYQPDASVALKEAVAK